MGRSVTYVCAGAALLLAAACSEQSSAPTAPGGTGSPSARAVFSGPPEVLQNAIIHRTVEAVAAAHAKGPPFGGSGSKELSYHGGVGGIGVATAPKVYLVLWGSQWNNNDPSDEAAILESFFAKVGGSLWLNSVTQYCQDVGSGTVFCNGAGSPAGNPPGLYAGVWADNGAAAPTRPKQSAIAAEAVRAAGHWGNGASANENAQYVIATATGNNSSGFGTQYCAYHSYTSSSTAGKVAYTNLPYITDAGASCGANFNGLGPAAGITIVEGHELAETITDQFPSGGWLDGNGAENGDKCAWSSATASESLNGTSFPVQPLWSNAANNNTGGCVQSFS